MADAKPAAAAPGDCGEEGELAKAMASNTMPICKYGLACRIITPEEEMSTKSPKEEQHWYKFQHPCFWCLKDGHPELGPPGMKCPLHPRLGMTGRGGVCPPVLAEMAAKHQCTNMDPDHRRCFRHPEGARTPRPKTHAHSARARWLHGTVPKHAPSHRHTRSVQPSSLSACAPLSACRCCGR